ncbi:MAG: TldD/PmbA family protein [Candidatus Aminicenantes bacterium]|nr:TldD/PmbA family protein [Candidatus Aminicenantes bacterium]
MNKEMQDLAAWVIKTAKTAGANDCRVDINSQRSVEISYRNHKPENIKEATTKGLYIQLYVNGRYSSQSTSDMRKDALKDFITNAIATTKLLAEDPYRTLPDPKYYQGRQKIDLEQVDPDYKNYTPENRHALVKAIESAALEKGGDKVISVTASTQDGHAEGFSMSSNGFEGYEEGTFYVAGAEMTVQDEGDRRPNGYEYAVAVNQNDLPSPGEVGKECAVRTMNLLGAKKVKTETLPIIIENRNVGRIFGGFLQAMTGRSIQQKQSFLADKIGKQIASEKFTLIDDPFVKGGLGSHLFDGDGLAAKKMSMIDKGVLKEFYVDWYYSRKLGWEPTTGSPSNLIVPPGKRSVEEIMNDLGRGIFITGFIGGNSNPTTGDASIGIIGHLFENGKPVQAVSEMNIADNHLKFWNKLVEVANDPYVYSSYRFPSLVFEDIVVAGL